MSWTCKNCETENKDDRIYCEVCGKRHEPIPNTVIAYPAPPIDSPPYRLIFAAISIVIVLFVFFFSISKSGSNTHVPNPTQNLSPTYRALPTNTSKHPTATKAPVRTSVPTHTSIPTYSWTPVDPETWKDVHAPYQSRLTTGDLAYVSTSITSLSVYQKPYLNHTQIGIVYPGDEVRIIKGPSSSSGMVWWKIQLVGSELSGWVSEGDKDAYWLIPVGKDNLEVWAACHASYQSRLDVGDKAYVSLYPDQPNRVRTKPYLSSDIKGKIYPGERIQIIEGPSCSGNMVWWKVRSLDTGLIGWTSEGDANYYWLVPEY